MATTSPRRQQALNGSSIAMPTAMKAGLWAAELSSNGHKSIGHLGIFVSRGVAERSMRILKNIY